MKILLAFFLLPLCAVASLAYPENGFRSRWLWYPEKVKPMTTRYFRRIIHLEEEAIDGELLVITDDAGELYVNGKRLKMLPLEQRETTIMSKRYSLDGAFVKGKNVIAVEISNNLADAGFIITGQLKLQSGSVFDILTDKSWKCAKELANDWQDIDFDDTDWLPPNDLGDCFCKPWVGLSNAAEHFLFPDEREELARKMALYTDISFLDSEPAMKASIASNGAMLGLDINGIITAPIMYILFQDPWLDGVEKEIQKLAEIGVNWLEFTPNLLPMMKENGTYDFSGVEKNIRHILALNHNAVLNIHLRFERSPGWWERLNPEELIKYSTGGAYEAEQAYRFRSASMASQPWRQAMQRTVKAFLEYASKQPWNKRVIGVRVSYGVYGEWHYYGMEASMPDNGPAMTREFRSFLSEKYQDDEALQRAWHRHDATLQNATVPGPSQRIGRGAILREPNTEEQQTLDYYECHSKVIRETLLGLAHTVKATRPGTLVGAYYGYTFGMPYGPEAQTVDLENVLASPDIDFLSQPHIYLDQRRVGNDGLMRTIPAVYRRYGKLMMFEDDTRTHLAQAPAYNDAKTPAESVAILRRNLSNTFLEGGGLQLLEFGSGRYSPNWWSAPELLETIRRGNEIWHKMYSKPAANNKRIAVVYEPSELLRHGAPKAPAHWTTAAGDLSLNALHRSSATFDLLTLKDFLLSPQPYQMAIFLNSYTLTTGERRSLKQKLAMPSIKRIVWIYAPGLVTENGFSAEAMSDLTGISLKYDMEPAQAIVYLNPQTTIGYKPGGKPMSVKPRIFADDSAATISGRYADGKAGFVRKELPDGKIVQWCGVHIMGPALWRSIIADARIHCHTNAGNVVYGNHFFEMLHVAKEGQYKIALPRSSAKVTDMFTGETIGTNLSVFELTTEAPQTWLLEF